MTVAGHVWYVGLLPGAAADASDLLAVRIKGIEDDLHRLGMTELVELAADQVPAPCRQRLTQLLDQRRLTRAGVASQSDEFPLPTLDEDVLEDVQ